MIASNLHIVKIIITPNELRGLAELVQKKIDTIKKGEVTLVATINTSDVNSVVQFHINPVR